jgi:hypothetical protein
LFLLTLGLVISQKIFVVLLIITWGKNSLGAEGGAAFYKSSLMIFPLPFFDNF